MRLYYILIVLLLLGLVNASIAWQPTTNTLFSPSSGCVQSGGYVYCIGASIDGYNSVYAQLGASGINSWTSTTAYPNEIFSSACAPYNGYVYCIGGVNDINKETVNSVYYANLDSSGIGAWQAGPDLPPANVMGGSCVAYNGILYCAGQAEYTAANVFNDTYYADILPSTHGLGSWTVNALGGSYPGYGGPTGYDEVWNPACQLSGNYIYCIGGQMLVPGFATDNAFYAPLTTTGIGPWSSTTYYPINVVDPLGCTVSPDNNIYCIGGGNSLTFGSFFYNNVYTAPLSSAGIGQWSPVTSYPINTMSTSSPTDCVFHGHNTYCIGEEVNVITGPDEYLVVNDVYFAQTYFPPLTATPNPFTLSNTVIDVGQYSTANTMISGGSGGPYSAQWTWINSNEVNNQVINTIFVGQGPTHVSFNPSGTLAYVTNYGSNTVNVIQVSSNTVINTITVGSGPVDVSFNPSGTLAYVTNVDSGIVNVIQVSSNTVINTITVGLEPFGVSFNPSGTLAYVTNYGSDTVNVIQVSSNTVINTITVGSSPQSVSFNPSGTLAYVTNSGSGTVNVIQVSSNTVINTITVGSGPFRVAFNPSGTLAYVTNSGGDTVNVIQVSSNTVINTITVGLAPFGVSFNPSGTLAYVTNYDSNTVNVIQVSSNTVINTITVGSLPSSVSFNPSGTLAYVTNYNSGTVSVIGNLPETSLQEIPSSGLMQLTAYAVNSNTVEFTFNGVAYTESTGQNTVYGTWTLYGFVQDNGTNIYYYGSNNIAFSSTLTINPAPPPPPPTTTTVQPTTTTGCSGICGSGGSGVSSTTTTILPLTVSVSPSYSSVYAGHYLNLVAKASGGIAPYSYQWYNDTSPCIVLYMSTNSSLRSQVVCPPPRPYPIAGQTSSTFTVKAGRLNKAVYVYLVNVTDSANVTVTSGYARIRTLNASNVTTTTNTTTSITTIPTTIPTTTLPTTVPAVTTTNVSSTSANITVMQSGPSSLNISGLYPNNNLGLVVNGYPLGIHISNASPTSLGLVINNKSVLLKKGVTSTLPVSTSQQFNITFTGFNGKNATMSLTAVLPSSAAGASTLPTTVPAAATITLNVSSASAGITVAKSGPSGFNISGLYPNSGLGLAVNGYPLGIHISNASPTSLGLVINNKSVLLKKGVTSTLPVSTSQQFNITFTGFNGKNATMSLIALPPSSPSSISRILSNIPVLNNLSPQVSGSNWPIYASIAVVIVLLAIYAILKMLRLKKLQIAKRSL